MIKKLFAIFVFAMTTSLNAETLSFPSFRLEIQDGWEHSIENSPSDGWGNVISVYQTNGVGILKILSYAAPAFVSKERLRNMTNVDLSTPLTWQNWGDYSGYQYDYSERGVFHRQWWLMNERTIVFLTYQCDPESKDIETEDIDKIVRSIMTTPALKRSDVVDFRDQRQIRGE